MLASIIAQYTFVLVINNMRTDYHFLISTRKQNNVICYMAMLYAKTLYM